MAQKLKAGYIMGQDYSIEPSLSRRIDILKSIGIIMVLYVHSYAMDMSFSGEYVVLDVPLWLGEIENAVSLLIGQAAIPIFYLTASVLLFRKRRPAGSAVAARLKSIGIPYLIFNSLWVLIFILLQNMSLTSAFFSGSSTPILSSSLREWLGLYGIGRHYPLNYPLWYLRDLMIVTLLSPAIWLLASRLPLLCAFITGALLLFPWGLPCEAALQWTMLGAMAVKWGVHTEKLDRCPLWAALLLYGLFFFFARGKNNYIINDLFFSFSLLFWLRLSKNLERSRAGELLIRLAPSVFIIYTCHELSMSSVKKLLNRLISPGPAVLAAEFFLIPAAILLLCLLFDRLTRKYTPGLHGVLTGKR